MSEHNQEKLTKLREGVKLIDDGVNSTLTTVDDIAKAFRIHPYLLNQIALGILKACRGYDGDGRINPMVAEAAKRIWD